VFRAVYELPLGFVSFVFYRLVRFSLRVLVRLATRARKEGFASWRVLDGAGLDKPLALPVTMTTGPRWNPHAFIASAGPFQVEKAVSVELAPMHNSARLWAVNLHRLRDNRNVARVGSLDGPFDEPCYAFALEPGTYVLGLRYYDWKGEVSLPAVFADGRAVVDGQPVVGQPNDFYADLSRRAGMFYLCLHYYAYVLLRYRRRFSEEFVARELLPVGNPETRFYYGVLAAGDRIQVTVDRDVLNSHALYLTTYNRRSFPEFWCEVGEPEFVSAASRVPGYYLIRLHRKAAVDVAAEATVAVVVTRAFTD
jgi:hypothetical protein